MKIQIFVDELYPYYVWFKEGESGYKEDGASLEVDDSFVEELKRIYKEFYDLRDELEDLYRKQKNQV